MEEFKTLKKQLEELVEQLQKMARDAFQTGAAAIFEKYPNVKSFGWTQYTPYWNDGETCEFGVLDYEEAIRLSIFGETPEEEDEDHEDRYYSKSEEDRAFHDHVAKDVIELLRTIGDDNLMATFGDHAEITVTREGATVSECYHD